MFTNGYREIQGIETLGKNLIYNQQHRGIISCQCRIHNSERILVIQHIEILENILISNVSSAESHALIKKSKRVAHGSVRLPGYNVKGIIAYRHPFLTCDVTQIAHYVRNAYAIEIISLTARKNGRDYLVLFRRTQYENGVRRRFFKGFQKSVEGLRRKHMDLIDDIDAVPAHLRRNLYLVHKGLYVLHTVIRGRIQFVNAI